MPKPTYEELESRVARLHHDYYSQKRRADALYAKLRSLENAVRSTIVVGEQIDADALYRLRKRVPDKPKPTLRQLHSRRMGVR